MQKSEVEQQLVKEGVFQAISNELAGLNLSTNEYLQVANSILDFALEKNAAKPLENQGVEVRVDHLPIVTDDLIIRACDPDRDFVHFDAWTRESRGREFLLSRLENNLEKPEKIFRNPANVFGIVCDPEEKPIGIVGFLNHEKQHGKAELRKLIGETGYRGKGLGKKASRLWLSYGQHGLKLRKVYLYTFDSNLRNIRINEELGFRLEGVFREEHIIDGKPKDILRMYRILDK